LDRLDRELVLLVVDFILAALPCRDGVLASSVLWLERNEADSASPGLDMQAPASLEGLPDTMLGA
jgi:hypothetical protein